MCFSATASFVTSGVLLPVGVHCLLKARSVAPGYSPIAAFPLLFGIQQFFEGLLWLSLGGNTSIDAHTMAVIFLFFAYFLWPSFVPFAAWRLEQGHFRRTLFLAICMLGFVFGTSLFVPLLINEHWLNYTLVKGSVLYEPVLIFDEILPRSVVRLIYALLVAVPLVLSSEHRVRTFGLIILVSVIASALAFEYAFVSIWCFFAALISIYIVRLLHQAGVDLDSERTVSLKPARSLSENNDRGEGVRF